MKTAAWAARQSRDNFVKAAAAAGYRSRAALKLTALQSKFRILQRGDAVVDLGAAPGSWLQVACQIVGAAPSATVRSDPQHTVCSLHAALSDPDLHAHLIANARLVMPHGDTQASSQLKPTPSTSPTPTPGTRKRARPSLLDIADMEVQAATAAPHTHTSPIATSTSSRPREQVIASSKLPSAGSLWESKGRVIGVDLLPIDPVPGALALQGDFTMPAVQGAVCRYLPHGMAHVVLSDMAHSFTGDHAVDTDKQLALAATAVRFSWATLRRDGHVLVKLRQGPGAQQLGKLLSRCFGEVDFMKPPASRKESAELYLIARGFRRGKLQPDMVTELGRMGAQGV